MATANKAFIPSSYVPDVITVSASSHSVALTGLTKSEDSVRVVNNAAETIFITFSIGAATADTTNFPVLSGAIEVFGIAPDVTHVNAIGTGASGKIYFSVGKGV